MGCRYSTRIKSENPSRKAVNLTHDNKEEDGFTGGSQKVSQLKIFTYNELKTATRNFRTGGIVGVDVFGGVFQGWLDEQTLAPAKPGTGIVTAVKKLKQDDFQGHNEWLTEINFQGQLHHPNIVKLIGYCLEDEHRLLVYEFLTEGSLDNLLFRSELLIFLPLLHFEFIRLKIFSTSGTSHVEPLSWSNRKKIALGAAKALAFLHSDSVNVIYRDLKPSGILLDSNFNAKLSDFGLARAGPSDDESHVSTRVMGTFGYAAPEYIATGHLTNKCDVYSFGVVLLEILSGKRALDRNRPAREQNLVEWIKPYLSSKRQVFKVMDTSIEGQHRVHEALKVAKLAIQCLSPEPQLRPTMVDVVSALEQLQDSCDIGSSKQ